MTNRFPRDFYGLHLRKILSFIFLFLDVEKCSQLLRFVHFQWVDFLDIEESNSYNNSHSSTIHLLCAVGTIKSNVFFQFNLGSSLYEFEICRYIFLNSILNRSYLSYHSQTHKSLTQHKPNTVFRTSLSVDVEAIK